MARTEFLALVLLSLMPRPSLAADTARARSGASETFTPPPLYAALFVEGREWTFHVESLTEDTDPDDPRARDGVVRDTKITRATCRVSKVVRWARALGSRLQCVGALSRGQVDEAIPAAGGFLDADWVATERGLWRLSGPVVDGPEPTLDALEMLIPARPKEMTKESAADNGGTYAQIRRDRSTWCATQATWSGDEDGNTFCWVPSTGLRAGRRYFLGGRYLEISFCEEPSFCRMLSNKALQRPSRRPARR
jgi:hypothetical protein